MTRLGSCLAKRPWLQLAFALAVLAAASVGAFLLGGCAARFVESQEQAMAEHVQLLVGTMRAAASDGFGEGHLEPGDGHFREVQA